MWQGEIEPSSSAHAIGSLADRIAAADLSRVALAHDLYAKASELSGRIAPESSFMPCDSPSGMHNLSRAIGNVILLGRNKLYAGRAERLLSRVEYLLSVDEEGTSR